LPESDDEGGFEKGCALIRSNLGTDPTEGSEEDFASAYAQAIWLENWRMKRKAEMIAAMFGKNQN